MVEVARSTKRVVQMGTHRRSGHSYAEAAKLIASGKLGKITVDPGVRHHEHVPQGHRQGGASDPPKDLDWDMWLGPRPYAPYQATITPFKFRWWDLYATRFSDNGVHFLDIMRWLIGDEPGPTRVSALGGRFVIDDDRTTPDVMEGMFQFASGRLTTFAQYETSGNRAMPRPAFAEFRGTQGALYVGDASFEVLPEHGGRYQDDREPRMEPITQEFDERLLPARARPHGQLPRLHPLRERSPMPTSRSATARPRWPFWPTSRWPPNRPSTGTPSAS